MSCIRVILSADLHTCRDGPTQLISGTNDQRTTTQGTVDHASIASRPCVLKRSTECSNFRLSFEQRSETPRARTPIAVSLIRELAKTNCFNGYATDDELGHVSSKVQGEKKIQFHSKAIDPA